MSAIAKKQPAEKQPPATSRCGGDEHPFPLSPEVINDPAHYRRWRTQKLARVGCWLDAPIVEIQDPAHLGQAELAALGERVAAMNFALYRCRTAGNATLSHRAFLGLCRQVGLDRLAANPLSHDMPEGASGVSEIRVGDDAQRAYIPYSNRALNWHTDGYYNPPAERVNGFAMHTIRPATAGGENRFLDHEVLYLLLRDRDPALAACLFSDEVMTIPPNTPEDGNKKMTRPAQTGPVFLLTGGRLQMRFTLRARHIHWKPSPEVRAALAEIRAILDDADNPFIVTRRFAAGEGVISNNVLHNRSAFEDAAGGREPPTKPRGRLVLRARFYNPIDIQPAILD